MRPQVGAGRAIASDVATVLGASVAATAAAWVVFELTGWAGSDGPTLPMLAAMPLRAAGLALLVAGVLASPARSFLLSCVVGVLIPAVLDLWPELSGLRALLAADVRHAGFSTGPNIAMGLAADMAASGALFCAAVALRSKGHR